MISLIRTVFVDLLIEGLLFFILGNIIFFYLMAIGEEVNPLTLKDLLFLIGLWLTTIAYRFLYLQIPISWIALYFSYTNKHNNSAMTRCLIYAVSYILVILTASAFNEMISALINPEKNFSKITLLSFVSMAISPFITNKILKA